MSFLLFAAVAVGSLAAAGGLATLVTYLTGKALGQTNPVKTIFTPDSSNSSNPPDDFWQKLYSYLAGGGSSTALTAFVQWFTDNWIVIFAVVTACVLVVILVTNWLSSRR